MPRSLSNRRFSRSVLWIGCMGVAGAAVLFVRASTGQPQPRFPATEQAPSAPQLAAANEAKIEAYPLSDASRKVLADWQQLATNRTDLKIAIDERTKQVIVFAPPAIHAQIRQQIAQQQLAAAPAAQAQPQTAEAAATEPVDGLSAPAGPVTLQLRNMPAAELHARLERLLTRALPVTSDAAGDWQTFIVEASTPGIGVNMSVNTRTAQVQIDGPPLQVAAWRSVVEALDSPPAAGGVTQLVATKPASHERVRQTLQVLQARTSGNRDETPAQRVAMLQQTQDAQADAGAQPDTAQPDQGAQPDALNLQPGQTALETAQQAAQLAEATGGLLGPVDVEYIEGLDILVIRGAQRDVQRVMEIINEIERLSAVTVPAIEIYELKFVDNIQLGALLNQMFAPTGPIGQRVGSLSITPLGKPNALLMIGRTETVDMAKSLIDRLDQPVVPTTQFHVFPLQNASAAEAKTLIDAFLRQDEEGNPQVPENQQGAAAAAANAPTLIPRALVVADARTNFLIVRASTRDLAEIAALLGEIDKPGAVAQLKVFTIRNGDANTLVTTLRTLFSVPAEGEAQASGGLSQGGVVRMQFSVDPRTNSIVAAGSADDLIVVEAILLQLDQGDVRERVNRVYRLNNAAAFDVANALNQWLIGRQTAQQQAEVTISPFEQIEQEVIIVPEQATNSLIISATPRYIQEVERLIRQLDERPPMVIIQVLIGEVTLSDTDQFGIELGLQDSLLFDRSLLGTLTTTVNTTTTQSAGGASVTTENEVIQNAPGVPGFNFNDVVNPLGNNLSTAALAGAGQVAAQGLSNFSVGRWDPSLGFGGFVFSASSDAVSVLLRALQENRRLEVLVGRNLLALDGQQGSVQVGQNVPRIVAATVDPLAGTTNQIQYEQVGLILNVIPRISPDGLIVLTIQAIKSEVGPELEGIPISIAPGGQVLRTRGIDITQALTTVSALSGQTVVLGGLMQTRKSDLHRRVPLIADIPLIGNLFRYDSVQETRRELIIILTPRIVYGKEDADLVKQIESSRMSWTLGDVVSLHGDTGLRTRCDEWNDADIEAVYPNYIPEEGLLPLSNRMMGEGSTLGAATCDPSGMPILESTPLPGYEVQPADEAPVTGPPMEMPLMQPPSGITLQSSSNPAADRYGLIPAAAEQAATAEEKPSMRLPEVYE